MHVINHVSFPILYGSKSEIHKLHMPTPKTLNYSMAQFGEIIKRVFQERSSSTINLHSNSYRVSLSVRTLEWASIAFSKDPTPRIFANKPCESSLLLLKETENALAETKPSRTGKKAPFNRENVRFVRNDAAIVYLTRFCLCMPLRTIAPTTPWWTIGYIVTYNVAERETLGSWSNHDDDGNKNPTNLHIWQWKTGFYTLCSCTFHLLTFWRRSRSFYEVKWPVLQLCGRREHMMTNVQFCLLYVPSAGSSLIPG